MAEDSRIEVINGIEIMMSPAAFTNHNHVKANVDTVFRVYLKGNICIPFSDGEKLVVDYPKKGDYIIPDFFLICVRSKQRRDGVHGAPDLVAEVLSPGSTIYDRGVKKNIYQKLGVKEYWIIDPDKKIIEIYMLKDGIYDLDTVYRIPDEEEPEKDRENAITSFFVNSFPDMNVNLEDIFEYVNSWE